MKYVSFTMFLSLGGFPEICIVHRVSFLRQGPSHGTDGAARHSEATLSGTLGPAPAPHNSSPPLTTLPSFLYDACGSVPPSRKHGPQLEELYSEDAVLVLPLPFTGTS